MRRISVVILVVLMMLALAGVAQAGPQVVLNGKTLTFQDAEPTIENGRTLVPLRAIFEALGAQINWDSNTQTVTATKGSTEIKLVIGGKANKNGQTVPLDVPAKIIDGRTMVPLRFISESLGVETYWLATFNTIDMISAETTISRPGFQRGVVFGGMLWRPEEFNLVDYNLDLAKQYGVQWINIIPNWFITPDYRGVEIRPFYTTDGEFPNKTGWITPTLTDDQIMQIITKARQRGMKVFLKPHVDPINWGPGIPGRGDIQPVDWEKWYQSYEKFILHYADLAQRTGVELFCVGTEIDPAANEGNGIGPAGGGQTEHMLSIISKVREHYKGPLTYSVSAWGEVWGPSMVKFWDALDYMGFEPYFAMSETPDTDVAALTKIFGEKIDLYAKTLSEKYNKPVIFTEAAIHSFDGSTSGSPLGPDNNKPRRVDLQEQARGMEALMQVAAERPWIMGVYWWAWYLVPQGDIVKWQENDAYDPFTGKPGGLVLSRWYHRIK